MRWGKVVNWTGCDVMRMGWDEMGWDGQLDGMIMGWDVRVGCIQVLDTS